LSSPTVFSRGDGQASSLHQPAVGVHPA
jgi:hypothetical protein